MNLKDYYREIAEREAEIADEFVFLVSLRTENGGREGVVSEVNRRTAAQMIVDKMARLATPDEVEEILAGREQLERRKEEAALQARLRRVIQAEEELTELKKQIQPVRQGK
ncbi:MAG: hypothetical protein HYX27_08850 [Acidobacteria bacterium]|nr:hypothetical protein [Acidobacteriota bacterium]